MTEDNGLVELPNGRVVGCAWQVVRKLGEGGCGSVYLVRNLEDDVEAAMKAESNGATGGCVLKLEVAILKRLAGRQHVAQFLFAARLTDFSYVIMTLLGESLQKIVKRMGRQITVSSQVRIAANVLFCLKQIHDIGFIHRDLKPANMALGYRTNAQECRFFHILDFGLARQFVVAQSDQPSRLLMRRPRERSLFRGTTRYCSIRMHDLTEQGRVDDLWSMIYLLAELRGPLPWGSQRDKRVVGEMKRLYSDEIVLQNSPMEFLEIAKHLRSLTYFHRPDYHKIYMLLMTVMEKGKFSWSDPFDWEMPAPVQLSREMVKATTQSREAAKPSRENLSKEEMMKTARNMSKETVSKENVSKERTSKESGIASAEMLLIGSAERTEEEQKRDKYMKILPHYYFLSLLGALLLSTYLYNYLFKESVYNITVDGSAVNFTGIDEFIPPFVNIASDYFVAPSYKLMSCGIRKSMSQLTVNTMCFLNNEKAFISQNHTMNETWLEKRACAYKDPKFRLLPENLIDDPETTRFAFIRDPFDRFVSLYLDKCLKEFNCWHCKNDMRCVVKNVYERLRKYKNHRAWKPIPKYMELHAAPLSWNCNFDKDLAKWHLLMIGADREQRTSSILQLANILKTHNVPDAIIRKIQDGSMDGETKHSTHKSTKRLLAEKQIREDPVVREYLHKIYFFDYLIFMFNRDPLDAKYQTDFWKVSQ
ncbi:unnamed protein product [Caenorhabditis sp. 36 PRJEB53466]|nr:unnamed protein product [Caenorhabditis sp. 36 PRJEB53466]